MWNEIDHTLSPELKNFLNFKTKKIYKQGSNNYYVALSIQVSAKKVYSILKVNRNLSYCRKNSAR